MLSPYVPDELCFEPFTTRHAGRLGVSSTALQSEPWRQMLRGVWVHKDLPDNRALRVKAVKLVLARDAFICGLTVAWLSGIDPWDPRSDLVWIGSPTGRRPRARPGCFIRELTVTAADLYVVDGIAATVPTRTAYDCARWLTRVEGVVVADAYAHLGLVKAEELAAYVNSHRGVRGVRQAEQVVALMDARSESAMETRTRLFLTDAGLPAPIPQYEVFDEAGSFVARLDFAYPDLRIAIEYDGAFHWEQRRDDDRRREALRALGWTVIVLSVDDLFRLRNATASRLRSLVLAA